MKTIYLKGLQCKEGRTAKDGSMIRHVTSRDLWEVYYASNLSFFQNDNIK